MRKFRTVFMRGGTSKGCLFHKNDLPKDKSEWDSIFLQAMGCPDPKQIDGLGGTVSSNNKIVVVWKSEEENIDIDYLVGQVIVGKKQVDYKSNCGNMTAATAAFAVEEELVKIVEPVTNVSMKNINTNKYINVTVPIDPKTHTFAHDGACHIAGVDGTAAELKVDFLNPAGSKTGKLLPTGNTIDVLNVPGYGKIEATILDVSNPFVLVRAEDIGLKGSELPEKINSNKDLCILLEKLRGMACVKMGFAKNLQDATDTQPSVPKIGFFTTPKSYIDIEGCDIKAEDMDVCVRVISIFKCHKTCPLSSANAISVATLLEGSLPHKVLSIPKSNQGIVRIGHPNGVMTMYPMFLKNNLTVNVPSVAVQRTARRIMEGTLYIRE